MEGVTGIVGQGERDSMAKTKMEKPEFIDSLNRDIESLEDHLKELKELKEIVSSDPKFKRAFEIMRISRKSMY